MDFTAMAAAVQELAQQWVPSRVEQVYILLHALKRPPPPPQHTPPPPPKK